MMQNMPPEHYNKKLHDNYMHMQNMIFGNKADFKVPILLIEQPEIPSLMQEDRAS